MSSSKGSAKKRAGTATNNSSSSNSSDHKTEQIDNDQKYDRMQEQIDWLTKELLQAKMANSSMSPHTPPSTSSVPQSPHQLHMSSAVTSVYKPRLITSLVLPKLSATVTPSSFASFKESFIQQLRLYNLQSYIQGDLDTVIKQIKQQFSTADINIITTHVKQQSISLCALLQSALSIHWKHIQDKLLESATENDTTILDRVFDLWNMVITTYENKNQFHIASLIISLTLIKHNSADDPFKTLEKFNEIKRQLAQAQVMVPEDVFSALFINALPSDMTSVQQQLLKPGHIKLNDVYETVSMYYQQKKAKTTSTTVAEKVMAVRNKICRYFAQGNCKKGDSCTYAHDTNSNKNKHNNKTKQKPSAQLTRASSDEVIVTSAFNDCIDNYECEVTDDIEYAHIAVQSGLDHLHLERSNEFILDSGASRNTTCKLNLLEKVQYVQPLPMVGVQSKIIYVNQVGLLKLNNRIHLGNTVYVPGGSTNLVSVSKLIDAGLTVKILKTKALVYKDNELLITFDRIGGVYIYTMPSELRNVDDSHDMDVVIHKPKQNIPRKGDKQQTSAPSSSAPSTSSSSSSTAVNESAKARTALMKARGQLKTAAPVTDNNQIIQAKLLTDVTNTHTQQQLMNVCMSKDIVHARYGHYGQHEKCETCVLAKGRRTKIGDQSTRAPAEHVYDRLHMDLIGPISTVDKNGQRVSVPTMGGKRYALVVVDEKSSYVHISLLANKGETKQEIINLINLIKTQHNKNVKEVHSDRGSEFINQTLNQFFTTHGIIHTTTTTYKPAHNGKAERMNGILCNAARAMLIHANAPVSLWGEAITTAVYLHNRTNLKRLDGKTPHEMIYNNVPKTHHLRVWGSDTMVYVQPHLRGKFDQLSAKGVLVGYSDQQNAYRVLLSDGNIQISRDVHFNESEFKNMAVHVQPDQQSINNTDYPKITFDDTTDDTNINDKVTITIMQSSSHQSSADQPQQQVNDDHQSVTHLPTIQENDDEQKYDVHDDIDLDFDQPDERSINSDNESDQPINNDSENDSHHTDNITQNESVITQQDLSQSATTTRYGRTIRPTTISTNDYAPSDRQYIRSLNIIDTPSSTFDDISMMTPAQAMKRSDAQQWKQAIQNEMNSLVELNVGTEVTRDLLPKGVKPITSRMLFKLKHDENNQPCQYKARLVAHGHKQTYGIDYVDTFAPVAKSKSIKMILNDAAMNDKELKQFDVQTAFLNAKLDESVYIELPNDIGPSSGKIWKLNKALYGLKQSPHQWNNEIHNTLTDKLGYKQIHADPCIYVKRVNNERIIIYLYVDDTVISYHKSIEQVWTDDFTVIKNTYKIKDLGDCQWILNMKVTRDRTNRTITLSQQAYIEQLLATHNLKQVTPMDNPADPSLTTHRDTSEPLDHQQHAVYRSIIGGLSYTASMTRIDIAYATAYLSRYLSAPTQQHLRAARRILRYLSTTSHYCMVFKPQNSTSSSTIYTIDAYADASHGNDLNDRKSTTGIIIKVSGNTICWQSKKQKCVAISSTEAEYYALSTALREAIWIKFWIEQVFGISQTIKLYCDNQSALEIAHHDSSHQRTKHIDIHYHFIRQYVNDGTVKLQWLPTKSMQADMLTKAMHTKQFQYLISQNLSI